MADNDKGDDDKDKMEGEEDAGGEGEEGGETAKTEEPAAALSGPGTMRRCFYVRFIRRRCCCHESTCHETRHGLVFAGDLDDHSLSISPVSPRSCPLRSRMLSFLIA
jgi:hypothetical protein